MPKFLPPVAAIIALSFAAPAIYAKPYSDTNTAINTENYNQQIAVLNKQIADLDAIDDPKNYELHLAILEQKTDLLYKRYQIALARDEANDDHLTNYEEQSAMSDEWLATSQEYLLNQSSLDVQLNLHDRMYELEGYYPLNTPVRVSTLDSQQINSHRIQVTQGNSYVVQIVSFVGCGDMNLTVYDKDRSIVRYVSELVPFVNFTAQYTGDYSAEVTMPNDGDEQCTYAIKIYVR